MALTKKIFRGKRPGEILTITLLVVIGFLITDILVDKLAVQALTRFLLRIVIQGQFIAILYLLYQAKESSRRLKGMEKKFTALRLQKTRRGRPIKIHSVH